MKDMEKTEMENFKELRLEELKNLPPHKDYKPVEGLYLPLGDVVTIRECSQEEFKTKGGIIMGASDRLEHAKIGYIMNRGELCSIPVKEGDTVAFDRQCSFGIHYNGVNYLRVPTYMVYFVIPPANYLEAYVADTVAKRRESRIAGENKVRERDAKQFEEKVGKREEEIKKKDKIK